MRFWRLGEPSVESPAPLRDPGPTEPGRWFLAILRPLRILFGTLGAIIIVVPVPVDRLLVLGHSSGPLLAGKFARWRYGPGTSSGRTVETTRKVPTLMANDLEVRLARRFVARRARLDRPGRRRGDVRWRVWLRVLLMAPAVGAGLFFLLVLVPEGNWRGLAILVCIAPGLVDFFWGPRAQRIGGGIDESSPDGSTD